ncbi:hypothetical protein DPMN_046814 [Dreissena polymorpha]|uniref:Uncharacterized protein n=1 Tax=Dreissena polymorpha TaxID=45954 RepID=A0A9D4D8Q3_DREPO|nr:hypothetical protein DPMN_046814 [Dreissena polymorpha]
MDRQFKCYMPPYRGHTNHSAKLEFQDPTDGGTIKYQSALYVPKGRIQDFCLGGAPGGFKAKPCLGGVYSVRVWWSFGGILGCDGWTYSVRVWWSFLAQTNQPTNRPTNQQTNRQGKNNMSPTTICEGVYSVRVWWSFSMGDGLGG